MTVFVAGATGGAPVDERPATVLVWFQLRSPALAEDFERLMAGERDVVQVDRWEEQISERLLWLADDLAHLVSSDGMLVVRPIL